MHVVATVIREGDRFVATCAEASVVGDGSTRAEALSSLREGLEELLRPHAVAPPDRTSAPKIEITTADAEADDPPERDGPGEA